MFNEPTQQPIIQGSHLFRDKNAMRQGLKEGLEQVEVDCTIPEVVVMKSFDHFLRRVDVLFPSHVQRVVAHPLLPAPPSSSDDSPLEGTSRATRHVRFSELIPDAGHVEAPIAPMDGTSDGTSSTTNGHNGTEGQSARRIAVVVGPEGDNGPLPRLPTLRRDRNTDLDVLPCCISALSYRITHQEDGKWKKSTSWR